MQKTNFATSTIPEVTSFLKVMYNAEFPESQKTHFSNFLFTEAVLTSIVKTTSEKIVYAFCYKKEKPSLNQMPWTEVFKVLKHVALQDLSSSNISSPVHATQFAMKKILEQIILPIRNNGQMGSGAFAIGKRAYAEVKPGMYRDPSKRIGASNMRFGEGNMIMQQIKNAEKANNIYR